METSLAGPPPTICGLVKDASIPPNVQPGQNLNVQVTLAEGYERTTVRWDLSGHEGPQWGEAASWEVLPSISELQNETLELHATVTARGCLAEDTSWSVPAFWSESERVMVLYNSAISRSLEVASRYADFRELKKEQLCDVNVPYADTLPASAFVVLFNRYRNCLYDLGNHITYVVPVYGVPYRLDGRIKDYTTNEPTVTSLDSLLMFGMSADAFDTPVVNPLLLEANTAEQTYEPYTDINSLRSEVEAPYLVVSRIDGAGPEEALELIERTEDAEALVAESGASGTVYIDGRYGDAPPASDEPGSLSSLEWNLWGSRYAFEDLSELDVIWDGHFEEVGTAPAPTVASDALVYLGGFSSRGYDDVYEWQTGAIAVHLDKESAASLDSDSWLTEALQAGLTAAIGVVNDPYAKGYVRVDQFSRYLLEGANFGEAGAMSNPAGGWQTVLVGDPLYRPFPAQP